MDSGELNPSAFSVKVSTYSGYKGEERPLRFYLKDQQYEVEEILDRWYGPESDYFKVMANDKGHYILCHRRDEDIWTLESFRRDF